MKNNYSRENDVNKMIVNPTDTTPIEREIRKTLLRRLDNILERLGRDYTCTKPYSLAELDERIFYFNLNN